MPNTITDPFATLVHFMREQGSVYNPPAILIAEVLTPPPNLTIKVGDLQVDNDNIYIVQSCLSTFSRTCRIKPIRRDNVPGSFSLSGRLVVTETNAGLTGSTSVGDHGSHTHTIATLNVDDTARFTGDDFEIIAQIDFQDTLKLGDIVAVMQTADRQTYIIIEKLVRPNE